jgi:hypothetical protein
LKTIEIIKKENYLPEQQNLIKIFELHSKGCMPELPIVFKIPDIHNKTKTHINRIPCKTIGKQNGHMIISMEVIDYVRLMAKSGIEVKIYDN